MFGDPLLSLVHHHERNHQYPFPRANLSNTNSNGTKLIHPTSHHMQTTPQVLQIGRQGIVATTGRPGFSGPPMQVQQNPQPVHGRSELVPQVLIPRPATLVSVSLLNPLIIIDTPLQVPVIQSRSQSRISLAGMLNSPDQSMPLLPSTSTPAAISAPIAVQHPTSNALIPLRCTVLWL